MQQDLIQLLQSNSYPGRGILLGRSSDGLSAVIAYFIMGRSENSRNRVFVPDGEGLRTQAFDMEKLTDPSLIIYHPVRVLDDVTIVTNGDQTDTVYDALRAGGSFEEALRTRTFEPDPPNYTPRISGLVDCVGGKLAYKLSILKSGNGNPDNPQRFFYEYAAPAAGVGHLIHTYRQDGNPIPSFSGEPTPVALSGDIDTLTAQLWDSLNRDNKVSLFVRFLPLSGVAPVTRIVNKHVREDVDNG